MSLLGLGTGMLGQLSDVASAPRRAVWSMLGLPESGNELMGKMGMDPESALAKALGIGAEIVGDPLNLFGIPMAGRLGNLASRLGPKYQRLLSESSELARPLAAADEAVMAERAAMASRHADEAQRLAGIGEAAMPQGDVLSRLMGMDVGGMTPERLARDALMPTSPYPMKMARTTPDVEQGLRAMGLAMEPEGGRLPMIPGMAPKGGRTPRPSRGLNDANSGYMTTPPPVKGLQATGVAGNRVLGSTGDFPFIPPPGNDYPASLLGFSPETRSSYLPILEARQDAAKSALMDALSRIEGYSIPMLAPWEQAMMMGGAGALATPIGRELGR